LCFGLAFGDFSSRQFVAVVLQVEQALSWNTSLQARGDEVCGVGHVPVRQLTAANDFAVHRGVSS